jgi:hypothetical protein
MTQAVTTLQDGFRFQARMFWSKAVWLLADNSHITKVGFEYGPKGFDDIWVEYDPIKTPSERSVNPVRRQHIQCKWHASPNTYSYTDLIEPDFINATASSLLQKVHAAQQTHAPDGRGLEFQLLTNWRVSGPLSKYIAQRSKSLRLDRLFSGKTDRSEAGIIRKAWREHLGIDDDELRILLSTLALQESPTSLDGLREMLNGMFLGVGLRCMHDSTFAYDQVVFDWMSQGLQEFDRHSFREACDTQDLLQAAQGRAIVYGVKSFEHPIDDLHDRCEKVLDLVASFDERLIRDQRSWTADLYPSLRSFLLDAAKKTDRLRLALDTHATLAFAAGSVLNVKCGREVELEQRTGDRRIWKAGDSEPAPSWATWVFEHQALNLNGDGQIVAVSLTHDIAADVRSYLSAAMPNAARLLIARPSTGISGRCVVSGQHALSLAEALSQQIAAEQSAGRLHIHLFIAGPNTFTFYLGQQQPRLGQITLYEFDFEGLHGNSYMPSISLPIK